MEYFFVSFLTYTLARPESGFKTFRFQNTAVKTFLRNDFHQILPVLPTKIRILINICCMFLTSHKCVMTALLSNQNVAQNCNLAAFEVKIFFAFKIFKSISVTVLLAKWQH